MIVQKMRVQRGWSQQDLADLSGLNVRTIQRIESGRSVSIDSFKALGAAFDVDFNALQAQTGPQIAPSAEQVEIALALNRVRRIQHFYQRLFRFCVIGSVLVVLTFTLMPNKLWLVPTMVVWALMIGLDALRTFEWLPWLGPEWELREIEKRLGRTL